MHPTPVLLPRIPWMEEPGVHGVAKNRTQLSDFTFTSFFISLTGCGSSGGLLSKERQHIFASFGKGP